MTGNMQNGPAPQGGMPGPAANMPTSQPQQFQRVPQGQPMPNMPVQPQGAQPMPRPHQAAPAAGGVPPVMGGGAGQPIPPASGGSGDGASAEGARKRKIIILIGVAVIVVIAIVCAFIFAGNAANSGFYDPDAKEGQASYKTLEEIEAERNRQMQEGMLNISIASQIEFDNGTAPGTAFIENVPSNKYVLKVTITTDSNGEVVYQSGGIRPDSTIETITLSEPLGAGVYPATATFSAYDPDTLQEVGQAAAKVTLVVKN